MTPWCCASFNSGLVGFPELVQLADCNPAIPHRMLSVRPQLRANGLELRPPTDYILVSSVRFGIDSLAEVNLDEHSGSSQT
jgi:hypothetical protein